MMSHGTIKINIKDKAGSFAENKELARKWREEKILPAFKNKKRIILDFSNVEAVTQSFIHALISYPLRELGEDALDMIEFKSCKNPVKEIVLIVIEYSLASKT